MKISYLFFFFLLFSYIPTESSPAVDISFPFESGMQATSDELWPQTCIADTFLATILCVRQWFRFQKAFISEVLGFSTIRRNAQKKVERLCCATNHVKPGLNLSRHCYKKANVFSM